MKDRLAFLAALAAAALFAALLFMPRFRSTRGPDLEDQGADPPGHVGLPTGSGSALASWHGGVPAGSASVGTGAAPAYVRVDPGGEGACPGGMVLVDGIYCPYVGHRCARYADEARDVCERFAPDVLCEGRLQRRRYCVDVYEYPNLEGVRPAVMPDWNLARHACAVEGKRLCTVEEWELACEGPQMWPYPYGMERDPAACNIDRDIPEPDLDAFSDPMKISEEVERLDRRVASGAMPGCVSPFGVHDMTGNVDEWVWNEEGKTEEKPFRSTLKGGYWGPIRARCRPITSTHNAWFSFYQVGFRCCADPLDGGKAKTPAPKGVRVPKRRTMDDPGRGPSRTPAEPPALYNPPPR